MSAQHSARPPARFTPSPLLTLFRLCRPRPPMNVARSSSRPKTSSPLASSAPSHSSVINSPLTVRSPLSSVKYSVTSPRGEARPPGVSALPMLLFCPAFVLSVARFRPLRCRRPFLRTRQRIGSVQEQPHGLTGCFSASAHPRCNGPLGDVSSQQPGARGSSTRASTTKRRWSVTCWGRARTTSTTACGATPPALTRAGSA